MREWSTCTCISAQNWILGKKVKKTLLRKERTTMLWLSPELIPLCLTLIRCHHRTTFQHIPVDDLWSTEPYYWMQHSQVAPGHLFPRRTMAETRDVTCHALAFWGRGSMEKIKIRHLTTHNLHKNWRATNETRKKIRFQRMHEY